MAIQEGADVVLVETSDVKKGKNLIAWGLDVPYDWNDLPIGTTFVALYGANRPFLESGAKLMAARSKAGVG
jgi:hypothetical protein